MKLRMAMLLLFFLYMTLFDDDVFGEVQLKATESVSYINEVLSDYPDILIITTSEIAEQIKHVMVLDSGISNLALTEAVDSVLSGADITTSVISEGASHAVGEGALELFSSVSVPVSPLSVLGLFFGIF